MENLKRSECFKVIISYVKVGQKKGTRNHKNDGFPRFTLIRKYPGIRIIYGFYIFSTKIQFSENHLIHL